MRALKGLLAALSMVAVIALLLLLPAALTPNGAVWPRAWSALAVIGVVTALSTVAMAVLLPEHFAMRQQGPFAGKERGQPWIDAAGLIAYILYLAAWVAFIPIDVFVLELLAPPGPLVSAAGGVAGVAGLMVTQLAVAQNRFATPTIHDQSAQGQRVVDTGLYGWVRHPLYAGNLVFFAGLALWLGSTAAFVGVVVQLAFTLARIAIEERHLQASLPDYVTYAKRVRGRLIPYIF